MLLLLRRRRKARPVWRRQRLPAATFDLPPKLLVPSVVFLPVVPTDPRRDLREGKTGELYLGVGQKIKRLKYNCNVVDWLDWLDDWLDDWLIGWLIRWLIEIDWLGLIDLDWIDWMTDRWIDWLIDLDWIDWMTDRLIDWLIDRLIERVINWMILIHWLIEVDCLKEWLKGL